MAREYLKLEKIYTDALETCDNFEDTVIDFIMQKDLLTRLSKDRDYAESLYRAAINLKGE